MSSPSERSDSSTAALRTSTASDTERTATASAASAPAREAAPTSRSASSVSAVWSSSEGIGGEFAAVEEPLVPAEHKHRDLQRQRPLLPASGRLSHAIA